MATRRHEDYNLLQRFPESFRTQMIITVATKRRHKKITSHYPFLGGHVIPNMDKNISEDYDKKFRLNSEFEQEY